MDRVTDTAYWIPSNASRDFRPDWISSSEIMTSLKSIPSRHLLLVADSCYSGKLLRGAAPTEGNPGVAVIQRLFSKKARVAITSGGDEPVRMRHPEAKIPFSPLLLRRIAMRTDTIIYNL